VAPLVFHATPSSIRGSKATPADVKAAEAAARKLAGVVADVPALKPPVGFNGVFVGVLMERDPSQARMRAVAPFDLWVRFGAPQMTGDEVNFLHFYINDLRPVILDHIGTRKWEDERGDLYLEPKVTGQVGGFPMYNDLLVVARPGESIWAPVPVERFARVLAGALKSDAEDAEKRRGQSTTAPDPSQPKDVQWYFGPVGAYKDVQAVVAGLDAAGRGAPACVIGTETPERWKMKIVPDGTAGCRRVVEANLGLFKQALPRTAIQLITVENIDWCRREVASRKEKTVGDCAANLEVVRQLDWQRVAGLLEK
jgi:hypothetical protein